MNTYEYLEDGISTLALIHNDMLPMKCTKCTSELMEEYNHDCNEVDSPVWFDANRLTEYYACPIMLIPSIIYQWYDEYVYIKEYGGIAKPYDECDSLFWWFCKTYDRYYNKYQSDKLEQHK